MLRELKASNLGPALEEAHRKYLDSVPGPFTHPEVDKRNAELLAKLGADPFALSRYSLGEPLLRVGAEQAASPELGTAP